MLTGLVADLGDDIAQLSFGLNLGIELAFVSVEHMLEFDVHFFLESLHLYF